MKSLNYVSPVLRLFPPLAQLQPFLIKIQIYWPLMRETIKLSVVKHFLARCRCCRRRQGPIK